MATDELGPPGAATTLVERPGARLVRALPCPSRSRGTRSRCSRRDLRGRVRLRRSSSIGLLERVHARAAAVRAVARRSASSGTAGASSGTAPRRSPTTSVAGHVARRQLARPGTAPTGVASVTSASPASGRPRSVASASASRTASMTWADDTGRSCSRSRAGDLGQPPRHDVVGRGEQVVVPARRVDARAVARRVRQPRVRPRDPGQHRLAPSACPLQDARVRGRGGQRRRSAPARARRRRRPRSRGPPPLRTRAGRVRMYASRRASRSLVAVRLPGVGLLAQRGHRLGDGRERRSRPSRDSMTSSHQRSGSSYPAASASRAIGSARTTARRRRPARRRPARARPSPAAGSEHAPDGQVENRAGAPCSHRPRAAPATRARRPRTARTTARARPWRRRRRAARRAGPCRRRRRSGSSASASAGPSTSTRRARRGRARRRAPTRRARPVMPNAEDVGPRHLEGDSSSAPRGHPLTSRQAR